MAAFVFPAPQLLPFQVGESITFYSLARGLTQVWVHGVRNLQNPARRFYDVVDDPQQLNNPGAFTAPVHYSWAEHLPDGRFVYESYGDAPAAQPQP